MILVFVYWLINNFELKIVLKLSALALVVFFVTLLIQPTINNEETGILKTGQYIYLGSINNEPLKWVVLNNDKDGFLLWCDKVVEYTEFDNLDETNKENPFGSNNWMDSDIRKWLNSEFKNNFDKEEASLINNTKLKNILSYNYIENKAGGNKPFYWNSITSYASQNYDSDAYYDYSTESVFLLDVYQLQEYVYENNLNYKMNERYWLRTPYYSSISMIRIVDKDGFVYHKDANVKAGVIPAIYIDKNLSMESGNGTYHNPFVIQKFGE
jgi:hypothetical protein